MGGNDMEEKGKKSFKNNIKNYLKIGAVAGMTMMSTISDTEAANNHSKAEKQTLHVAEHIMPNEQYSNTKQQYAAISFELTKLAREYNLAVKIGDKDKEKTIKEKIDELREKRLELQKHILEEEKTHEQLQKQEFNNSLKVHARANDKEANDQQARQFKHRDNNQMER